MRTIETKIYQFDELSESAKDTMDIDEIRSLVSRSGSHFFDRDTMRFFKSRVDSECEERERKQVEASS